MENIKCVYVVKKNSFDVNISAIKSMTGLGVDVPELAAVVTSRNSDTYSLEKRVEMERRV